MYVCMYVRSKELNMLCCNMSISVSSCSAAASSWTEDSKGCGEVEVEAAEALASLGGGGGVVVDNGAWGSKGRRSNNNNNNNSSSNKRGVISSGESEGAYAPLPFDLNMDQNDLYEQEVEKDGEPSDEVKVEDEDEHEPADPTRILRIGGRSKHDISEAEKEARRVRRILANRESARQTIRRRQALYEELKRKSAELASENEDLKRTKGLAVQEFQSLQTTNHSLKDKITQITGLQLGKNSSIELANNTGVHPPKWHQFLPNSVIVQPGPSSEMMISPSESPFISHERGNKTESTNQQQQQEPCCILPYPWLLSLKISERETLSDNRHVCSTSSVIPGSKSSAKRERPSILEHGMFNCCLSPGTPTKSEVSKKKSNAGAGAEARRHRREVIKLKSLHYESAFRRRLGRE